MNKNTLIKAFVAIISPFVFSPVDAQISDSITSHRFPHLKASITTTASNIALNRVNRYILPSGREWADVSWASWKENLRHTPEWDWDLFTTNWFAHPYAGSMYYNSARTVGLSYWQSAGYTIAGTAMWEYFGEILPPSLNDFYTNILGGFHLGEVIYRLSENLLDDRSFGKKRRNKEILNFFVNPIGEANRLLFGMTNDHFFHRNHIHNELKMNLSFMGLQILHSSMSSQQQLFPLIELDIAYGSLDEGEQKINPFDIFWFKAWMRFDKRNISNENAFPLPYWNLRSSAILHGKRTILEQKIRLVGVFQDYDYIKTENYELGSLGFSGGWIISHDKEHFGLNLIVNIGGIALGASSSQALDLVKPEVPDAFRDYTMGSGYLAKWQMTMEFKSLGKIKMGYDHWKMWVISGPSGSEQVHLTDLEYMYPISNKIMFGLAHNLYIRKGKYFIENQKINESDKSSELKFLITYSL